MGWRKVTQSIYQCKNNIMKFLGTREYNTASSKWAEWECMDFLLDRKLITKKDYDLSSIVHHNSWVWYYVDARWGNTKFSIRVL